LTNLNPAVFTNQQQTTETSWNDRIGYNWARL